MKKYYWHGIDLNGENKKGVAFATNHVELQSDLLKDRIALLKFKQKDFNFLSNVFNFSKKVSLGQKTLFLDQLSILVGSGIEIIKALNLLKKQLKNKRLKEIIALITNDIANGESLSNCLQKFPDIFSLSDAYIIKSGENSGKLDLVLEFLAENLQQKLRLIKQLKQAALLPIITLFFSLLIVLGVFVFVIPQFEMLFNSFEKELPTSTQFLISVSNFLRSEQGAYCLLGGLLFLYVGKFAFSTKFFSKLKDRIVLKIYFFRKIVLFYNLITFLQTLSMFLNSGVDLKKSLEFSAQTIKNSYLKQKTKKVTGLVVQGKSLHNAFEVIGTQYFPEKLIVFVDIGEQSGNLSQMLDKVSQMFKQDLKNRLKIFTTIFQPALLIILGLLIVFLMFSIYLPIFNMASIF